MSQPLLDLLPRNRFHFAAFDLLQPPLHLLLPSLLHVGIRSFIQARYQLLSHFSTLVGGQFERFFQHDLGLFRHDEPPMTSPADPLLSLWSEGLQETTDVTFLIGQE